MNVSTFEAAKFWTAKIDLSTVVREVGQLFYLFDVAETSFRNVTEVPNFYRHAWRSFLVFIILENVLLYWQNKQILRLNDSITSLSLGLIQECGRLLFRGGETAAYIYIYNKWRLVDLPWDSPWTWYAALLGVDFFYYWVHRASHEIHIFWAQHQVHHSSEEFNITVGLRQSIFQGWCSSILNATYLVSSLIFRQYYIWLHFLPISLRNMRNIVVFLLFELPLWNLDSSTFFVQSYTFLRILRWLAPRFP